MVCLQPRVLDSFGPGPIRPGSPTFRKLDSTDGCFRFLPEKVPLSFDRCVGPCTRIRLIANAGPIRLEKSKMYLTFPNWSRGGVLRILRKMKSPGFIENDSRFGTDVVRFFEKTTCQYFKLSHRLFTLRTQCHCRSGSPPLFRTASPGGVADEQTLHASKPSLPGTCALPAVLIVGKSLAS